MSIANTNSNSKEVVILQRDDTNAFYGEVHISGSDRIIYIDSSGHVNADDSASFYALFPVIATPSDYSVSSSWASHSFSAESSSWASQSISASWAPPIPTDFAISASWASHSFSAESSSWASRSFAATSASWASASLTTISASFASRSLISISSSWASSSISSSFAYSSSWATPHSASEIPMLALANSKYNNVQQLQDIFHSAGWVGGGIITTGSTSGSFSVSSGDGLIRATNNSTASIYWFSWSGSSFTASNIPNQEFFVYASYNNGLPVVVTSSIDPDLADYQTNVLLARIYYVSSSLRQEMHINPTVRETVGDYAKLMILFNKSIMPYAREVGGILAGGSGLTINIAAGAFWEGLNRFTTNIFNSSGSDKFSYYYLSGSTWSEIEDNQYIDNSYYNNTGSGLIPLSTGNYKSDWIYLAVDGDVHEVFGQRQYNSLSESQASTIPEILPPELLTDSFLIGRVIVQSSSLSLVEVDSVFFNPFVVSSGGGAPSPTDHDSLTGLQGGTAGQYYHLTATEYLGTGTGVFVRQDGATITNAIVSGLLFGTSSWSSTSSISIFCESADFALDSLFSLTSSYLVVGRSIVLCSAFTPVLLGADSAEITTPFSPLDGTSSISWNVKRLSIRTQTAETAGSSITVEKSNSTGPFSATTVGTVNLVSGPYEAVTTGSLGSVNSGNKIRFNVTSLGTAQNFTIICEISNA